MDGTKLVRVVTHMQEVTNDLAEAEENIDATPIYVHAAQVFFSLFYFLAFYSYSLLFQCSAKLAKDGDYEKARLNGLSYRRFLDKESRKKGSKSSSRKMYSQWCHQQEAIDQVCFVFFVFFVFFYFPI